jgi:hypothetical protein
MPEIKMPPPPPPPAPMDAPEVEVLVQQGDIKSTKVVVSVDYKALLDIEIKPIVSEEERELLAQACQEKGGVYPIFPTHFVRKGNEIVGCFSIYSPTVQSNCVLVDGT